MGRIQVLPAAVAQRIAAGEVIERPASVVKELCENALDAGARRIRVDLTAGGCAAVIVGDDGGGMEPEDAVLAFARHATSKLQRFEDLAGLHTLGFRGEALPSIAAVAHVCLTTRPPQASAGTEVRIDGGGRPQSREVGAAPGTLVAVRDLFYNVPARRAALRRAASERAAVVDAVTAAALARPDVAFSVHDDEREFLATPGDGDLMSAAVALWGPDVAAGLLQVAEAADGWVVDGLCGKPSVARGNRALQFFAVDGRPVRAEPVRGPVAAAYAHLLQAHRYPVFVLHLRGGGGGLYDANVHPSKQEVRFYRSDAVHSLCHHAVRQALRTAELVPDLPPSAAAAWGGETARPVVPDGGASYWPSGAGVAPEARAFAMEAQRPARPALGPGWAEAAPAGEGGVQGCAEAGSAAATGRDRLPFLEPLGQVGAMYVVAAGADGLYILDQHAAHERIAFEVFGGEQAPPAQILLQPLAVDLDPLQWARWEELAADLARLGLVSEAFGESTVLVRSVPAGLESDPAGALLRALRPEGTGAPGMLAARRAMAACKAAIKAGQTLGYADLTALLSQLAGCAEPFTCPHGRPTLLRLGLGELERHFGRR